MTANSATLNDALAHWRAAQTLIGKAGAGELFSKIVDVNDLLSQVDPKRQPEHACSLLVWLYDNVEQKEEYKNILVNTSFDLAIEALKRKDTSGFIDRLKGAARVDPDVGEMVRKLRKLSGSVMRRIISEAERHPLGSQVKSVRSDMYGMVLFRSIMMVANSDLPPGFGPEHIPLIMNEVILSATEDLRS